MLLCNDSQGKVEMQGTPFDVSTSSKLFAELIGRVKTPKVEENVKTVGRRRSVTLSTRSSISSNESGDFESVWEYEADQGVQMEASSKGKVKGSIPMNYFKAGANWPLLVVLLLLFIFVQFIASTTDYFVSVW